MECFVVLMENVYRHCGYAIIKRIVRKARMSSSLARHPIATTVSLAVGNTFSIRHIVSLLTTNAIWWSIAWMAVMSLSAVSNDHDAHLRNCFYCVRPKLYIYIFCSQRFVNVNQTTFTVACRIMLQA